jgi:imidazolonepropionase-like amidohydrolase
MIRKSILHVLILVLAVGSCLAQDIALKGGTIITIANGVIEKGTIVIQRGKITAIGNDIVIPPGIKIIDVTGKFVMPGIIDTHVHLALTGMSDINELTDPVTPQIWMKDAIIPDHDSVRISLSGGVTTVKTMHGSANVIGGVNATIKLKYGRSVEDMLVKDVRHQLKMALGENPKRLYGRDKKRTPSTRMGNAYVARKAFQEAKEYKAKWDKYEKDYAEGKRETPPPKKDLRMETLKLVLEKKLAIDCHTYRADEIVWIINFCKEWDVDLIQISHCIDGYKVADIMAAADVSFGGWVDSWGFKEEAYDNCPWGFKIMHDAGTNIVINTDSVTPNVIRYLNLEAARVLKYNDLPEVEVLKMITLNAARALEMEHRVGSLEKGKDGDIAVFSKHPLDSTTRCLLTIIEGEIYFDYVKDSLTAGGGNDD